MKRVHPSCGRVYEYFLGGFAGSEGKRGGEFYTPRSVVRVLVENGGGGEALGQER